MAVYNLQLAFNPVNVCSLGDMEGEILWFPWAQTVVKVYHNSWIDIAGTSFVGVGTRDIEIRHSRTVTCVIKR